MGLAKQDSGEVMQVRSNVFAVACMVFLIECEVLLICVYDTQVCELLERFLYKLSVNTFICVRAPYQKIECFQLSSRLEHVPSKLL